MTLNDVEDVNVVPPWVPVDTFPEVNAPVLESVLASVVPSTVLVNVAVAPVTKPVPVMTSVAATEPVVSEVTLSDV